MDLLSLEVVVVSAKDLNKLELPSKMKTYVVVTLTGGALSDQKFQTNVDTKGGENPRWNFPMKFIVGRSAANSLLSFTLMSETAVGDEYIGHVKLPVAELMKSVVDGNSMQYVSCPVVETSGHTTRGEINFTYKFGASQARVGHVQQGRAEGIGKDQMVTGVGISVAGDCLLQSLFPDEVAPFGIETVVLPDIESADVSDASVVESAGDFNASIIESTDVLDASIIESTDVSDASIIESTEVITDSADGSDAS